MPKEPTYEELERRVAFLEKQLIELSPVKGLPNSGQNLSDLIIDSLPGIFYYFDDQGRFLRWNKNFETASGYSHDEISRMEPLDFFRGADRDRVAKRIVETFQKGRSSVEADFVHKNGSTTPFYFTGMRLTIDDRNYLTGMGIDMTDRRRAETALVHFKNAVDAASDAIGISTPEGLHWYQNRAFDELFGEVGPDPPSRVYVDERIGREVFQAIMGGRQWTGEADMYGRHGDILRILLRAYAVSDDRGQVKSLVGIHTDITERKRHEKELRKTRALFEAAINQSPSGILIADAPDVKIRIANPAAFGIRGGSRGTLTGIDVAKHAERWQTCHLDGTPYDPKDLPLSRAVLKGEISRNVEVIIRHESGEERLVSANAAPIRDADGTVLAGIVVFHDITEKTKMERQLRQVQKFEAIATLAGGVAHDFNNLLMGMQGRVSLMLMDSRSSHPHAEHLIALEEYIRSAAQLTKQLLGFARGGKYEVKPTDINDVVLDSSAMFGRTKKEIRIHAKCPDTPLVVEMDRGQIEQVLLNMYVNAWQAMPEGGDLFLETTRVVLDDLYCSPHRIMPGNYAQVSVTDTGIGMTAETCQRVFDPFFTTKDKTRGTGLGLASAYGIVQNHGGVITVYSEIGRGTTFNIHLPLSGKAAHQAAAPQEKIEKGEETILLVDDEAMIIDVGKALLEKLGYQVIAVESGAAAVEALKSRTRIDLVILDLIMPGMDGSKTFDRIREIYPDMPVILASGYAINGQAGEIMRRGCNGFIQKPFNIHDISRKIRKVLDSKTT